MLFEVMKAVNNFFVVDTRGGDWSVINGEIDLPFVATGQYYLIEGSIFNDGVHQKGSESLEDEDFHGIVKALAIPRDFLHLVEEIAEWQEKQGNPSPYKSESFTGYSYTRASAADGENITWKEAFKKRLHIWRRL